MCGRSWRAPSQQPVQGWAAGWAASPPGPPASPPGLPWNGGGSPCYRVSRVGHRGGTSARIPLCSLSTLLLAAFQGTSPSRWSGSLGLIFFSVLPGSPDSAALERPGLFCAPSLRSDSTGAAGLGSPSRSLVCCAEDFKYQKCFLRRVNTKAL